jgi:hypothetical protein
MGMTDPDGAAAARVTHSEVAPVYAPVYAPLYSPRPVRSGYSCTSAELSDLLIMQKLPLVAGRTRSADAGLAPSWVMSRRVPGFT